MAWSVESVMGSTILRTRIRLRTPYRSVKVGVRPYPNVFVQVSRHTSRTLVGLTTRPIGRWSVRVKSVMGERAPCRAIRIPTCS